MSIPGKEEGGYGVLRVVNNSYGHIQTDKGSRKIMAVADLYYFVFVFATTPCCSHSAFAAAFGFAVTKAYGSDLAHAIMNIDGSPCGSDEIDDS